MTFTAVTTLGFGLSMDAFAASLGQGAASDGKKRLFHALMLGLLFGFFQATMPLLGWALGTAFHDTFGAVDHWIAFLLLGVLGILMVRTGLHSGGESPDLARGWRLAALAIATSVDAAAAGITLTMLGLPVWLSCAVIGAITCALTIGGALLGGAVGTRLGKTAETAGGAILILLGCKILAEHLYLA